MEIIIVVAVLVGIALWWGNHVKTEKSKTDDAIDSWIPGGPGKDPSKHPLARFTKSSDESDKPWPYGEKLAEGKIHTKVIDYADIAIAQMPDPKSSAYRVETPAPALAVDGHGDVHEVKPAKKAPAKKPAAKKTAAKAPAKKAPAKKSST
jgi:hypothetical protein